MFVKNIRSLLSFFFEKQKKKEKKEKLRYFVDGGLCIASRKSKQMEHILLPEFKNQGMQYVTSVHRIEFKSLNVRNEVP